MLERHGSYFSQDSQGGQWVNFVPLVFDLKRAPPRLRSARTHKVLVQDKKFIYFENTTENTLDVVIALNRSSNNPVAEI